MNKEFKVGDRVKVVGHPYIKDETPATVRICGMWFDDCWFKVKFGNDGIDFLIDIKYLEKIKEEWLHFKTTNRGNDPLISTIDKLDKEVRLYNCMYQWKKEFDPEEVDWEDVEDKWYISRRFGDWRTDFTVTIKQNLQVYFTTKEKAEQFLKWL